ncbi:Aste57867_18794 [Aphanomyces stellatus]|uniref:Aste57867_18794 protein n=1 Tax=Aphanomyces stellatus TaxID=120398 RepID=A0A485LBC5_9STRA|nr:hypothetical protein As57867_018730 [Aphanomyces stellatus]VFT95528.1 Aste57867_18794 [Aphanomyces stellatus]
MDPSSVLAPSARPKESIASRTRTKVSLVNVEIEELESFLDDDPSYLGLDMEVIEEEENYRRFLTSLLPNVGTEDDLSFLSEEDDEYEPHDEDDDVDEEEDAVDTEDIPKSELSGLLWDSSNAKLHDTAASSGAALLPAAAKTSTSSFVSIQPGAPLKGSLTQQQMAHLASQMHKHFQLLCQSMLLHPSPETEVMLKDLQRRGEAVRQWKESVVRKLRPETTATTSSTDSGAMNARRITRSFTTAHAAIMNPSMYEINSLLKPMDDLTMESLASHLGAVDFHLTNPAQSEDAKFTASEDRLLVHGVKQCSPKINWQVIQRQFLPMKTQDQLRTRYRFLTSAKAPENPVKDFFVNVLPREKIPWLIEEELRMLRGMVSFPESERNRFAKIAHTLLPHRSRGEIRKKWSRMLAEMPDYSVDEDGTTEQDQQLARLKKYLEQKQDEKEKQEIKKEEEIKEAKAATTNAPPACSDKHLHPALFYTPWALLHPSYLLQHTCTHNWPWQAKSFKQRGEPTDSVDKSWTSFLSVGDEDDDEDDEDDSEYEQEELLASSDEDDERSSTPIEPTLRLRHLNGPHTSEKAKRTLAALERRISGLPSAPTASPPPSLSSSVVHHHHWRHHDAIEVEELVDDSASQDDDDDFECEELLPSSDDEVDDDTVHAAAAMVAWPSAPPPLTRLELLQKRMSGYMDDLPTPDDPFA